ncbi:MAG: LLM class flavin-dependent oxidoreductase, partial [Chloroflexi bacterium]|nr:LLM class flavin-dependent oxidoreductase [Chloroflexota bacterium]
GSARQNFYKQAYARQGYASLAERVQALWLKGRRDEAAALIPDEFVLQANLLGTAQMVRQRVRTYRDAGITTLHVSPVGATLEHRLEALASLVALVREVEAE